MTKRTRSAEAIVWIAATLLGSAFASGQDALRRGSFLEVNGAKLYYEECGSAPRAVVLVHDGVLDSSAWDDVWPEFCRRFHTIRFDRTHYSCAKVARS